jgi:outer membrane biosynthesis protein TonB
MRSLVAILATLVLFGGCRSEETTLAPDTISTETTATALSTTEFPAATGTIVELPSESPVPPPATQTQPTATAAPAVRPPAQTPAQPAPRETAPPRSEPAQPAAQPTAPAQKEPAPQPTPPPAAKEPAPQPQPEPEVKAPAPAPAPATSSRLPKTHTVNKGGAMHAPGLETPVQRCGACHGKDLKGGKAAPSCFSCHDQVW